MLIAGLILILFNLQTLRQLAFPLAFLILLMPPPSAVLYGLGATLSVVSAEDSNAILNALGIPSTISSEYGNPIIQVTRSNGAVIPFMLDIACSGVYSLVGFMIFAIFFVYILRDKLWKKAAIFPIGILIFYLLNIARITIILMIGYHYGEETALQVFHMVGGWTLIFLGTLLLLTIAEKILKTQIRLRTTLSALCQHSSGRPDQPQDFCSSCGRLLSYPGVQLERRDVVKMVAIATAVVMLLYIQAPVFALKKGPAEVILHTPTGEQIATEVLPEVEGYTLQFVYRDTNFEQAAKQDASLVYAYISDSGTQETLWTTLEVASARSSLHRWEVCLITWPETHGFQPKVTQLELGDRQILENPPIIARYLVFQYITTNRTQAVLYWYEKSMFEINSTSQERHVKISVISYLNSSEVTTEVEEKMATIATSIAEYWQPIKRWTQITILLSQNGDRLTVIATGLLTILVVITGFKRRRERKANTTAYQKLSEPFQQIVNAIHETERTTTPTLGNILSAHQKTVGKMINKEQLLQVLTELEKTGMIRSQVVSKEDEPIQIWKTAVSFAETPKD